MRTLDESKNLRLKGIMEGGESKIFLHYPRGLGASLQSLCEQVYGVFSMCEVFVHD